MKRCKWAKKEVFWNYHDNEWGVPVYDDKVHFEFLILEGAQAGLSWETILKRRENYRKAFANFNPEKVAKFNSVDEKDLLQNKGIVRNKLKIKSAIKNAKVFLKIQNEFESFDNYIWGFVEFSQIVNYVKTVEEMPVNTSLSDEISKDLKKRGMSFVGSTIIYSYLQAVGIVDDHEVGCFRKDQNKSRNPNS